jgi:hypothetical protein
MKIEKRLTVAYIDRTIRAEGLPATKIFPLENRSEANAFASLEKSRVMTKRMKIYNL